MSEPMWCQIRIKMPLTWLPDPAKPNDPPKIVDDLQPEDAYLEDDELGAKEGWMIWLVQGDGNYGLNDDTIRYCLDWLSEHGVPYHAHDEPKYELEGEIDFFDGVEHHAALGDNNGYPTLNHSMWVGMKDDPDPVAKVQAYFDSVTVPSLEDCSIAHLPIDYPNDEGGET